VAWINMVSGTVYHILLPILMEGSTTSPNMSRGTYPPRNPRSSPARAADYSQLKKRVSTEAMTVFFAQLPG
jgi:hypothetical protein